MNIVWLRRDLRLHDHSALHVALQQNKPVQPIFVFDSEILKRFNNPKDSRLSFLADTLIHLHTELKKRGGKLWVFHGKSVDILPSFKSPIYAAEDFEPATIARDKAVAGKAELHLTLDHLLCHPAQVLKDDGTAYKVFTPYARSWYGALQASWFEERVVNDAGRYNTAPCIIPTLDLEQGAAHLLKQFGYDYNPIAEWPVGDGQKRLAYFEKSILDGYKTSRDFVGVDGTSRLSPYLRFGLVSIRECYRIAVNSPLAGESQSNAMRWGATTEKSPHGTHFAEARAFPLPREGGANKWIAELIWREFYAMILYRFPESVNLEFQPQTRGLNWENNPAHIAAWKEGRTGFPVVDAAMRQLKTTGWMHNRARMIVASFMTKDLLTDWRIGEEHFSQYLMDYELASNVGGWQWAASTGTDAQPYFRIFNPYLQSKRFDPEGAYIKKYIPELGHLNLSEIHEPSPLLAPNYPQPIVNHAAAKDAAIALFKQKS